MDPTANLAEQRRIVARFIDGPADGHETASSDHARLCELVEALDEWLSRGGFLPDQWQR